MYFERLILDAEARRVLSASVAEEGVWRGGRLLHSALGKEDHAWILEVVLRSLEGSGLAPPAKLVRVEGEEAAGGVRYLVFCDEDAQGRALADTKELDEVLSAISGLVEIF